MTCSVMQRQIKMQVYHRRYYTCSPVCSGLSVSPPPFPATAAAPSDTKQQLPDESRNSHRQTAEGSLRPGGHTHHCDNATGHFPLLTKGHLLLTSLQRSLSTTQLHSVGTFQRKSSHLSGLNFGSFVPVLSPPLLRPCWMANPPSRLSGLPPITVYSI